MSPMLSVRNLSVTFPTPAGPARAVEDVSFDLDAGSSLALVGESGSGKTVTSMALTALVEPPGYTSPDSRVLFDEQDILALDGPALSRVRGRQIGFVFQDPYASLNPVRTIGSQLVETLLAHGTVDRSQARQAARDLLELVGIGDPEHRLDQYPHELSGGMSQRVLIALALAPKPRLLIADEPTSALDLTVQAQILDLLAEIRRRMGMAMLIVTHDLGVAARMSDRTIVMYGGRVVEIGPTATVLSAPQHPCTRRLLDAASAVLGARAPYGASGMDRPLLEVHELSTTFALPGGGPDRMFKAVDSVSIAIERGSTLAVVGESGAGKSTLGRSILRLVEPQDGRVTFDGTDIRELGADGMRRLRRRMQIVFQDAGAAMNPRHTVGAFVREPLEIHGLVDRKTIAERTARLLGEVELDPLYAERFPHELSGGQRQRAGIARALACDPDFIVLDEPVSHLDVSVQAQIVDLLRQIGRRRNLTYLLITHDVSVVRRMAARIAVMYAGRIVEEGDAVDVLSHPAHPYTTVLLSAALTPDGHVDPGRVAIAGEPPSIIHRPAGCAFHPRCPHPETDERCRSEPPELRTITGDRHAACHFAERPLA